MIEAELKARLRDSAAVRAALERLATGVVQEYRDTYFDNPAGELDATDRELRIRGILGDDRPRHVLTFKDPAVDEASGSKPEREVDVTDPAAAGDILAALGYPPVLAFTKRCINYRFSRGGRELLATIVVVPEIEGTFLEVETLADDDDVSEALAVVRAILAELGVGAEELTTDTYTGAVRAARAAEMIRGNR